jgi:hypothetical protein
MADDTPGGTNQADDIQNQLNQAFKELDQIRNTQQSISDPDGLQAVERDILRATDKNRRADDRP